jgi:hypothetical protein
MAEGKEVIRSLHTAVAKAAAEDPDPARVTPRVVADLGLPEAALPVISRTITGHVRALGRGEEIRE